MSDVDVDPVQHIINSFLAGATIDELVEEFDDRPLDHPMIEGIIRLAMR